MKTDFSQQLLNNISQNSWTYRALDFDCQTFTKTDVKALFKALRHNKMITRLTFYGCRFNEKTLAQLGKSLATNTTLQEFSFRLLPVPPGAKFSGKMLAKIIADALRNNKTLRVCDLGNSELHDDGAYAIAEVLNGTSLSELILDWCCIGDRGLIALGEALHTNHSLRRLNLNNNFSRTHSEPDKAILMASIQTFVAHLSKNNSLERLHFIPAFPNANISFLFSRLQANHKTLKTIIHNEVAHHNSPQGKMRLANQKALAVTIGFFRANKGNALINSIFPLLPSIVAHATDQATIDSTSRLEHFSEENVFLNLLSDRNEYKDDAPTDTKPNLLK